MAKQSCENCKVYNKSLLSALTKEDLKVLNENITCTTYRKNQTIFTPGTRPNGVYCLNNGKIKIFKTGTSGKEQIIRMVLPGEFFGLRSVISDNNYTTTAVAIENSIACNIGINDFRKIIYKKPDITDSIIAFLSDMLENANNKVTSVAQNTVRERLAETLLSLNAIFKDDSHSEMNFTVVDLSRNDLACLVGTATETIIRLLSDFKSEKLISVKGRKIIILNIKGLERIANF